MGPNLVKDTEGLKEVQEEWYGTLQVTLHEANDSNHIEAQTAVICISSIHTHQHLQLNFQSISSYAINFYFLSFLSLELPSGGHFSSS